MLYIFFFNILIYYKHWNTRKKNVGMAFAPQKSNMKRRTNGCVVGPDGGQNNGGGAGGGTDHGVNVDAVVTVHVVVVVAHRSRHLVHGGQESIRRVHRKHCVSAVTV